MYWTTRYLVAKVDHSYGWGNFLNIKYIVFYSTQEKAKREQKEKVKAQ